MSEREQLSTSMTFDFRLQASKVIYWLSHQILLIPYRNLRNIGSRDKSLRYNTEDRMLVFFVNYTIKPLTYSPPTTAKSKKKDIIDEKFPKLKTAFSHILDAQRIPDNRGTNKHTQSTSYSQ